MAGVGDSAGFIPLKMENFFSGFPAFDPGFGEVLIYGNQGET